MSYHRDRDPLVVLHGDYTRYGYTTPWHGRVVDLWIEDDATQGLEGHESPQHAFVRITKQEPKDEVARFDVPGNDYDYFMILYRGGWVITYTPSGGRVGVVVRVARDEGL